MTAARTTQRLHSSAARDAHTRASTALYEVYAGCGGAEVQGRDGTLVQALLVDADYPERGVEIWHLSGDPHRPGGRTVLAHFTMVGHPGHVRPVVHSTLKALLRTVCGTS